MASTDSKVLLKIEEKVKDQDFLQRLYLVFIVPFELYRVVVSSLLIVFVPQSCNGGQLCTIQENMETTSFNYKAGLVCNYFTMIVFAVMYFVEIIRENALIKFLEVNPLLTNRNSEVGRNLTLLPDHKKDHILFIIKIYKYVGAFGILMYIANAVISGVIISRYILSEQTYVVFATNVLFMVMKFTDVYWTIAAEPNVFLSAYLRTKVQYNDVDPEHKLTAL